MKEFFLEAQIPLVQNQEWIESLTLDIGYRYSDYSIGHNTDTYKFQGEYTPVTGFKFRGGYSRASRVANIRELFEPSTLGLWSGVDPCGTTTSAPTPVHTAAQCANSGVTAAQYAAGVPNNPAGQYNELTGGNTTLAPEKSNSFTVGAVLTPNQIPNLQLSIDYWSIEIKGAISNLDSQFVVDQCGLSGDPAFCSLVNRGPNGSLWLGNGYVDNSNVNIGFFKTSGIDIFAFYPHIVGQAGKNNLPVSESDSAEIRRCAFRKTMQVMPGRAHRIFSFYQPIQACQRKPAIF